MKQRLDQRVSLYGEKRLTDAQVIALQALDKGNLLRKRVGYEADGVLIRHKTIEALQNQFLAKTDNGGCSGTASITERGRKLLRLIEEAGR